MESWAITSGRMRVLVLPSQLPAKGTHPFTAMFPWGLSSNSGDTDTQPLSRSNSAVASAKSISSTLKDADSDGNSGWSFPYRRIQ